MKQAFYLEPTAGGTKTSWVRLRIGGAAERNLRFDERRRQRGASASISTFQWAGAVQRTNLRPPVITQGVAASVAPDVTGGIPRQGVMAWVTVYLGTGGIGLVPLSNLYADRVDTIDDSDAVRLPGGGSLGLRAAQWDSHAVFGVDPNDWQFLIAPDIRAGDVKVSRDGGQTWAVDQRLTEQVLQGGRLKMYDLDDYHMQVTKIAFDPYHDGRILVGTRDAGVICTADDGKTWRTIKNSDRISYVTGFHFYPNGAVHIASWGHGIWFLRRTSGCSETDPPYWDRFPPVEEVETAGVLTRGKPEEPPAPRGVPDPGVAKLFLTTAVSVQRSRRRRAGQRPPGRGTRLSARKGRDARHSWKRRVQAGGDGREGRHLLDVRAIARGSALREVHPRGHRAGGQGPRPPPSSPSPSWTTSDWSESHGSRAPRSPPKAFPRFRAAACRNFFSGARVVG